MKRKDFNYFEKQCDCEVSGFRVNKITLFVNKIMFDKFDVSGCWRIVGSGATFRNPPTEPRPAPLC